MLICSCIFFSKRLQNKCFRSGKLNEFTPDSKNMIAEKLRFHQVSNLRQCSVACRTPSPLSYLGRALTKTSLTLKCR